MNRILKHCASPVTHARQGSGKRHKYLTFVDMVTAFAPIGFRDVVIIGKMLSIPVFNKDEMVYLSGSEEYLRDNNTLSTEVFLRSKTHWFSLDKMRRLQRTLPDLRLTKCGLSVTMYCHLLSEASEQYLTSVPLHIAKSQWVTNTLHASGLCYADAGHALANLVDNRLIVSEQRGQSTYRLI